MALSLLLLPLYSLSLSLLLPGRSASSILTMTAMVLAILLSLCTSYECLLADLYSQAYLLCTSLPMGTISLLILADGYSSLLLLMVSLVTAMVTVYSAWYLHSDPHVASFLGLLTLFLFSMALLIGSASLIGLFVGWELVGLTSYLLISWYSTRSYAPVAGMKAILLNRPGDYTLFLLAVVAFSLTGSTSWSQLYLMLPYGLGSLSLLDSVAPMPLVLSILLIISVAGKSAQLGLHL